MSKRHIETNYKYVELLVSKSQNSIPYVEGSGGLLCLAKRAGIDDEGDEFIHFRQFQRHAIKSPQWDSNIPDSSNPPFYITF